MSEVIDKIAEQIEHSSKSDLNSKIAIVVALSATLVAVFNIKDNNIVQAMSLAQAHEIDSWSFYQAKSMKQHLAESMKSQLKLAALTNTQKIVKLEIQKQLDAETARIEKYEKEKEEIKAKAEGFQREYDRLNLHDDQFDLSEALISLALSILGITALTQNRKLFVFGIAFSLTGAFFGVAGFLGWGIHPEWLTSILG